MTERTIRLGDVQYIGNRPYRTGFLRAQFWPVERHDEAAMKRVARRENILVWGPPLYHYTSLSGFKGIIESRGFWASDSRFLNDAHEMRHGAELAAEVLSQIVRRSRVPAFRPIAKAVRDNILRPPKVGHLIACFSTLRDSLEQWRGYGGSGGVCIGVGVNHQKQRAPMFYGSSMLPHRVFYSARAKQALVLSLLRRFEIEYRTDMEAMRGHWPDDHDQHYVERLTSTLSGAIVGFKNLAFGHEAEVRVVLETTLSTKSAGLVDPDGSRRTNRLQPWPNQPE